MSQVPIFDANEAKHAMCLLHPTHLCRHFEGALDLNPKVTLVYEHFVVPHHVVFISYPYLTSQNASPHVYCD